MKKHIMTVLCMASAALTSFASQMASQPWVEKRLHEEHTNIISEIALSPGGVSKAYVDMKVSDGMKSVSDSIPGKISAAVQPKPGIVGTKIATIGGKDIYAPEGGGSGGVSKAYVDQEVEGAKRYTDEKIASLNQDGDPTVTYMSGTDKITLTLKFAKADNAAIRIIDSNVEGMKKGTMFAYDDFGNYCNYTNSVCPVIASSIVSNGTVITGNNHYEYITNEVTVVTNIVGRFTNTFFSTRLRFDVNGLHFLGRSNLRGIIECFELDNSSTNRITFARFVVTDDVKNKLLTPINRGFSILDFVFPSCYAKWVTDRNGVYWDELTFEYIDFLDASITDKNGHMSQVHVPVDIDLVILPGGTDYEDLSEDNFPNGRDPAAIIRQIEEIIVEAGFGDVLDQLRPIIQKRVNKAFEGIDIDYPPIPPPVEDPKQNPDPNGDPECEHKNLKYHDCDFGWVCECDYVLHSPQKHNYEEDEDRRTCAICVNKYQVGNKIYHCDHMTRDRRYHKFPGGNPPGGITSGCYCKYREVTQPHPKNRLVDIKTPEGRRWWDNGDKCARKQKCGHCETVIIAEEKDHLAINNDFDYRPAIEGCDLWLVCKRCGHEEHIETLDNHIGPVVVDKDRVYVSKTETNHWANVSYKCEKCGYFPIGTGTKEGEGPHTLHLTGNWIYVNDENHAKTNRCDYFYSKGDSTNEHHYCTYSKMFVTNHSNVSESSWTPKDNMYHYKTRHCNECNHDISNLEAKHDRYDDAVQFDHFDTYPQLTNFWCQSHSSGKSGEDPKNWWLDQTGGHIGENLCYTCLGRYHDLTWRACKYESINSFRISDSKYIATCDICGIQLESPRLANCMRYLNREYHAEFLCREIGGSAFRCTPYLNAEQHDLDDDGYCWICDTIVSDQPGNVEFDTNVLPSQFDGGWGTGWPSNPDQIIGH